MEPLWGRETLARQGANADERNADERASPKGSEQKHPRVGTGALLLQRDYVGGPRLLRRRGNLLRAQGQGERHSALHLRDDRGSEDSGGRGVCRLLVESSTSQKTPSTSFGDPFPLLVQSTSREGPTIFIPWAACIRSSSSGVGSLFISQLSRKNASNEPAGWIATSSVPGSSPMYAQTCGTMRATNSESPGRSVNRSWPTSKAKSPLIA